MNLTKKYYTVTINLKGVFMNNKFLQSILISTIFVSSSFATSLTLKGGAYEFLRTHSTKLTSKDIDLRSNYYNLSNSIKFWTL